MPTAPQFAWPWRRVYTPPWKQLARSAIRVWAQGGLGSAWLKRGIWVWVSVFPLTGRCINLSLCLSFPQSKDNRIHFMKVIYLWSAENSAGHKVSTVQVSQIKELATFHSFKPTSLWGWEHVNTGCSHFEAPLHTIHIHTSSFLWKGEAFRLKDNLVSFLKKKKSALFFLTRILNSRKIFRKYK